METLKPKYASQQARVRRGLIPFQVWVTPTLRQRIKVAAAKQETTMSDLAAEMLAEALKAKKRSNV
jgi:predicted HicB family RNase H-like nuclease